MSSTETTTDTTVEAGSDDPGPADIVLDDEERELVAAELATIVPALTGARRERHERLAAAVETGTVPGELTDVLGGLLELALQTARARRLYRAEGERILTAVFRRTPRGAELDAQVRDVNAALRSLAGAELDSVRVRLRTVGHFSITIRSDAARITLGVRPDSVNVESVAVGESRDEQADEQADQSRNGPTSAGRTT